MSRRKPPINKPSTYTAPENKVPVNISLRLAPALAKKLDSYCSETGVSKNGVISLAISDFLAERA